MDWVLDLGTELGKYKNKPKAGCLCLICERCLTQE